MKALVTIVLLTSGFFTASAQNTNPNYDEALAQKVGADDYGMKKYIFVVLKTGPNTSADNAFVAEAFAGHMANMEKMVAAKQLIVAGPFGKNSNAFRGLFILNVTTVEEAEALLQTDPAIKEGLLTPELYPWYGSAALSEYLGAADKVWKKNP